MRHLAGFLHDACPYPLLCSVYSGHHTYLISPYDLDVNPSLWLSVVSSNKGTSVGKSEYIISLGRNFVMGITIPILICVLSFSKWLQLVAPR